MPELKCTVQTCLHNQNYYCDLDSIKVGGSSAKHAQDTCCDSFEERKDGNSYSNTMKEASPKSEIDCKATECMYNEQCHCHAGKISVEGCNNYKYCHSPVDLLPYSGWSTSSNLWRFLVIGFFTLFFFFSSFNFYIPHILLFFPKHV